MFLHWRFLRVTVQARQQVADAEVSKDHQQESDDRKICRALAFPAAGNACVEKGGICEPGDQRTRFFRVKTPRPSPRFVRPDRTGYQQHCETCKCEARGLVHQAVEKLETRKSLT